ncbi:MAG: DegV family protein [Anaerotignaceae bacterium]
MGKIVITTETCSDLTEQMISDNNIYTIPMHVVFEHGSFDDGSMPVEVIYEYFKKTKKVPKTSAVNPEEFVAFFNKIAKENPDCEIIHICYSSQASSTYQNALIALGEEHLQAKVHLIDSFNVSLGAGNIVMRAAKILRENTDITPEKLVEEIKEYRPRVYKSFVPERLEYLVAGGRVSNAAALGAAILRIKPRVDIIDGKLVATKKYRGSMKMIVDKYMDDVINNINLSKELVYVVYVPGGDMKNVDRMVERFTEAGFKEVVVGSTGCVLSTHGGPGAIGFTGYLENPRF